MQGQIVVNVDILVYEFCLKKKKKKIVTAT